MEISKMKRPNDNKTYFVFSKKCFDEGVKHAIGVDFVNGPAHLITTGSTGSGKTHLNKVILYSISTSIPNCSITVLDYKASDYIFARGSKGLYEFNDVIEGLNYFYDEFENRLNGEDESRNFKMLVVEELSSIVNSLSKQEATEFKKKLGIITNLGRSFNVHICYSTQRADSSQFPNGVRDSINLVIALGNISKEAKSMLFDEVKDEMVNPQSRGTGYMLINGILHEIIVPRVKNKASFEECIIDTLNR